MCTVVASWQPGEPTPVRVLAMRDEFAGRDFDPPGAWWPDQSQVLGGRDRRAGGTWCASDVMAGATAVVLNRPDRRQAAPGAASRGVLPLLALAHGEGWAEHVDVTPMAGFNLVLLRPDALVWWRWDGTSVAREQLTPGLHQFKPTGRVDDVPQALRDTAAEPDGQAWLRAVDDAQPREDGSGLVVRRTIGDDSYETVFGQLITARPGRLRLDYRANVARGHGPWTTRIEDGAPVDGRHAPRAQRWVS